MGNHQLVDVSDRHSRRLRGARLSTAFFGAAVLDGADHGDTPLPSGTLPHRDHGARFLP